MSAGSFVATLGALLLVLGVPLAALWALRRWRPGWVATSPATRRLVVVERLPLGRGGALLLVETDGAVALVATGAAAIAVLRS